MAQTLYAHMNKWKKKKLPYFVYWAVLASHRELCNLYARYVSRAGAVPCFMTPQRQQTPGLGMFHECAGKWVEQTKH
jgi:hypothetical protein